MDENLNIVLQWFTKCGVLNINLDKLKRQLSVIDEWFKHNCRGAFLAVTGFGKTYVAIITIFRLNLKYKDATITVIVPTVLLKQDWERHIYNFDLENVEVFVANGYVASYLEKRKLIRGYKHKCTLLVLDEVHNYLSESGVLLNQTIDATQCEMLLGLSATLDEKERQILDSFYIPICSEVSMSEARRYQYVSEYVIYNYEIHLTPTEKLEYSRMNDIHNTNFAKFRWFPEMDKNYELARACCSGKDVVCRVGNEVGTGRQWRNWYAAKQEWNGIDDEAIWSPKSINKYAQQWNWAMRERKDYLYKHPRKLEAAKAIIEFLDLKTITFSETTEIADKLTTLLGEKARSYHSNLGSGVEYITETKTRKQYTAAKNLRLKMKGTLTVDNSESKPIYNISYTKEIPIGKDKVLRRIKQEFIDNKFPWLNTAKAFNEGQDVPEVECALIFAANSTRRATIQRMGRAIRFVEGKVAKIISLVIMDTQEESWTKNRQKGDTNIRWIKTLDELNQIV